MADNSNTNKNGDAQAKRIGIHRVEIDTPALLTMVKHCRDADLKVGARGNLMGVLKDSLVHGQQLLITQTMPELAGSKVGMQELAEAIENESQKLMDNAKVGFYLSVNMGLTFTIETLN